MSRAASAIRMPVSISRSASAMWPVMSITRPRCVRARPSRKESRVASARPMYPGRMDRMESYWAVVNNGSITARSESAGVSGFPDSDFCAFAPSKSVASSTKGVTTRRRFMAENRQRPLTIRYRATHDHYRRGLLSPLYTPAQIRTQARSIERPRRASCHDLRHSGRFAPGWYGCAPWPGSGEWPRSRSRTYAARSNRPTLLILTLPRYR